MIPDWWIFILLALVAYRLWRLLAEDTILDGPRKRLYGLVGWQEDDPAPDTYREKTALFIECPWCAGAWVSGLVYLIWLWLLGNPDHPSDVLLGVGVWFALSAAVGLLRTNLDPPEE